METRGCREEMSTGTVMQLFSGGSHGGGHDAGTAAVQSPLSRERLRWLPGAGQKCNSQSQGDPDTAGRAMGGCLSRFSHHSLDLLP